MKQGARSQRAKYRDEQKWLSSSSKTPSQNSAATSSCSTSNSETVQELPDIHTAAVGEQLQTDYQIIQLPPDDAELATNDAELTANDTATNTLVSTALMARIEYLEAEITQLTKQQQVKSYFRIEDIQSDDQLVCFYTGFISYAVFLAFFEFLGPVVDKLNYWGCSKASKQCRTKVLSAKNQLFLTLVKLRLNLKTVDLAYRFGISNTQVSRYITTWICFLYHHLKEVDWVPAVNQVLATLPTSFQEKFPKTYAILDASEVFIETPTDLHLQSSTWSEYKQHNTVKFLVACTPNGAVLYISPVYAGAISDVELTRKSGFLEILQDKPGVSIMADKGFTIKDLLAELNVQLNIPPFLDSKKQLPLQDVQAGRRIASLRIHVERAIGRIKTYSILKGTIPLTMARLINQIIYVCAFLTNFQPALVPLSDDCKLPSERDVDEYFLQLSDDDSESDL